MVRIKNLFVLMGLLVACGGVGDSPETIRWSHSYVFGGRPVELVVRVDQDSIDVAQNLHVQLKLSSSSQVRAMLPEAREIALKRLVLRRAETAPPEPGDDGGHVEQLTLILEPTLPGEARVGPIRVHYEQEEGGTWIEHTLEAEPISIAIRSLGVPEEGPIEFKPPRGVRSPRVNLVPYYVLGVAGVLLLFGALYWFFLRRGRITAPPVPPYRLALKELRALESRGLLQRGELNRYYMELSYILRHYVEQAFNIPALELTTLEFAQALRSYDVVDGDQEARARELLEEADLVKFAKFDPGGERARDLLHLAKGFVRSTAPREEKTHGV